MPKPTKQSKRLIRKRRVRSKIFGTKERPRVCVSTTLSGMFVQLIDDSKGFTLISMRDKDFKGTKTERAKLLGAQIAKKAAEKNISSAVFDRRASRYHGRIKAVADALRQGGLKF